LRPIEGVDSSKGLLVTVMNCTGDVLNFGVAVEKAKAGNPKMQLEMLVVGDVVGVPRSRAGKVGRRSIAGTVFVHKIMGAMAVAGFGVDEVKRVGTLVGRSIVSIGVSLNRVHVPGQPIEDVSDRTLGANGVELGMGIHNEPGSGRSGQAAKLPALVEEMLHQMLNADDKERGFLEVRADKMVLLVNNLGPLSALELGAIVTEVADQLRKTYSVALARVYAGTYMTSLDGPGFSISLLNVVGTERYFSCLTRQAKLWGGLLRLVAKLGEANGIMW
jgi:triose/dihydroxyacetone kinase / FAD-AMP lyase (cyclizing)